MADRPSLPPLGPTEQERHWQQAVDWIVKHLRALCALQADEEKKRPVLAIAKTIEQETMNSLRRSYPLRASAPPTTEPSEAAVIAAGEAHFHYTRNCGHTVESYRIALRAAYAIDRGPPPTTEQTIRFGNEEKVLVSVERYNQLCREYVARSSRLFWQGYWEGATDSDEEIEKSKETAAHVLDNRELDWTRASCGRAVDAPREEEEKT